MISTSPSPQIDRIPGTPLHAVRGDAEVSVLDPPRRSGAGNIVLLFTSGTGKRVLKVYRSRQGRIAEAVANLITVGIQGRRPLDAASRALTERQSLAIWSRHGFDVFTVLESPVPEGIHDPALWTEYCPGRRLDRLLFDPETDPALIESLLVRHAREMSRRHSLALSTGEPLLCQTNGHAKHVLIHEDRLITFDFEGGWSADFPVMEALTHELATFTRSIQKAAGDRRDLTVDAFLSGYEDTTLLSDIIQWGLHGRSPRRFFRRTIDLLARAGDSKVGALRVLARRRSGW